MPFDLGDSAQTARPPKGVNVNGIISDLNRRQRADDRQVIRKGKGKPAPTQMGTHGSDPDFVVVDGTGTSAVFTVAKAQRYYSVWASLDLDLPAGVEAWGTLGVVGSITASGYAKGIPTEIAVAGTGMALGPITTARGASVFVTVSTTTTDEIGGFVRFTAVPLLPGVPVSSSAG